MDKLILLSTSKKIEHEAQILTGLFEAGLQVLHLRKPEMSTREMTKLIEDIPQKYRSRIVIHSHYELAFKLNLRGIHVNKRKRKRKLITGIKLFILRLRRPDLQISTSFSNL